MDIISQINLKVANFEAENNRNAVGILVGYTTAIKIDIALKKIEYLPESSTIKDFKIDDIPVYKTPDHLKDEIIIF